MDRKRGYNSIPPMSKKAKLTDRGLSLTSQNRYDIKKFTKKQKENEGDKMMAVIDPGLKDAVAVNIVSIKDALNAESIIENGHYWSLSNKKYQQQRGINDMTAFEERRRKDNPEYQDALNKFRNVIRRTSNLETFEKYMKVFGENWKILWTEKAHQGRLIRKWISAKRSQKSLDKLADAIVGRASKRKRNKLDDPETRKTARVDKDKRRIVFFGNGTFRSGGFGYSCFPRKKLVHKLATRTHCSILDEFRTSKCCPGCGHDMVEDGEKHRIRHCSNNDSDDEKRCPLMKPDGTSFTEDRDKSATINMALCAHNALYYHKRPLHLCRNKEEIDLQNIVPAL